ncbi:MAG: bifunctional 3,4-dihydroxy-2-butanone-4-phosphate synthase/GTP cyclohydrolase II [Flammeovirgaceae bacterium]|nr:bifunctional 3,4-dihydroxy-2-butanone-4-phosphate synthase/GTP cyclohydrolase II [Flammeovirgaceae bacterium]|tara:strand:- start:3387 stop:4598 length:1212 start_codon:yes stop_codon:yes gene_type:complete
MKNKLNKISEAIEAIKNGEIIIVVDDENRENEGDFVCASSLINPEKINFMSKEGRGLICCSLNSERCDELDLELMVGKNTDIYGTSFTVSVDLKGNGVSTGISASDRAKTIRALVDKKVNSSSFSKPGHIFPLRSMEGGVLRRAGHTEASVDLPELAGLYPSGVICEILNEDGSMARLNNLFSVAQKHGLVIISIKDLIEYKLKEESLIEEKETVDLPTEFGNFKLISFEQKDTKDIHLALKKGEWDEEDEVLVRVHSSCVTGDILGSLRCDCGSQLHRALKMIDKKGQGLLLYMNQEGRGIGLINKLKAYVLQEKGYDTVEANHKLGFKMDHRDYGVGAQILKSLGIKKINLLTNNPKKRVGLIGYGLKIMRNTKIEIKPNSFNKKYLETKRDKMGHDILKD